MKVVPVPSVTLTNGVKVPVLSLGTAHGVFQPIEDDNFTGFLPEKTYRQAQLALESGIRSFDMGRIYRSHRPMGHVLGEWFRQGQLVREDLFLTTKVFHGNSEPVASKNSHLHNLEELTAEQTATKVEEEIEEALVDLGVGRIDLLLMHWPSRSSQGGDSATSNFARERRIAAWKVLEKFHEKGWARAIGVSNFSEIHLQQLLDDGACVQPMVNQIEASLAVKYPRIEEYCKKKGIQLMAFSPFKLGMIFQESETEDLVGEIAKQHNKSYAQIALRFLIQKGYAVTYLSNNPERMTSNHDIFSFELTQDEMLTLSTLPQEVGNNWGLPTPYDLN